MSQAPKTSKINLNIIISTISQKKKIALLHNQNRFNILLYSISFPNKFETKAQIFILYFTHFLLVCQFMPKLNSSPKCAKRIGNESKHNIFLGCGSIEYFVCHQTEKAANLHNCPFCFLRAKNVRLSSTKQVSAK